jgi:hypothetical protein
MFDSQKLSFENFVMGYKHGVYIFTSDSCRVCQDYKRDIEWINNCFLYFVDVNTEEEKSILAKIIDRTALPATVAYLDNEIKFIRMGEVFEADWIEFDQFLKQFPDKPLPRDEIQRRIDKQKNRCLLTYYIFPQDISEEKRTELMNKSHEYNELPIDIDRLCIGVDNKERERMLEGSYHFAKLVLWKDPNANISNYSSFANDILIGYTNANQEIKFLQRNME